MISSRPSWSSENPGEILHCMVTTVLDFGAPRASRTNDVETNTKALGRI